MPEKNSKKSVKIPKKVRISKKISTGSKPTKKKARTTEKITENPAKRGRRKSAVRPTCDEGEIFVRNRIDDVRWLCSLSESELDFLIGLKTLIIRRAKMVEQESLAEKFDLKMLRVLSYTLMEYCKEEMKGAAGESAAACLERSNFLKVRLGDKYGSTGVEELMGYLRISNSRGGADEEFESTGFEEMMGFVEMSDDDLAPGKRKRSGKMKKTSGNEGELKG